MKKRRKKENILTNTKDKIFCDVLGDFWESECFFDSWERFWEGGGGGGEG